MALYDELGGAPAVDTALTRFYPRVMADPQLRPFFVGVDLDDLKQHVAAFFALATGGPTGYEGPSLRAVHSRLVRNGLNDEVFDAFIGLFEDVLRELGVTDDQRGQVMALLQGARNEVLNR